MLARNSARQQSHHDLFPKRKDRPTGQGTGLGLSLSYENIQAHQGSIQVRSRKDECTEFIVQLPVLTQPLHSHRQMPVPYELKKGNFPELEKQRSEVLVYD